MGWTSPRQKQWRLAAQLVNVYTHPTFLFKPNETGGQGHAEDDAARTTSSVSVLPCNRNNDGD